jgi:hypothetical protein
MSKQLMHFIATLQYFMFECQVKEKKKELTRCIFIYSKYIAAFSGMDLRLKAI